MKKKILTVGVITALCSSMLFTSCIGSFQLTNNLLDWNRSIGNKFVNELVFLAFWILPVYEVAAAADVLVINSIEFWSGTNPITKGSYKIRTQNNMEYIIKSDKNGYTIINPADKKKVRLDFEPIKREWSINKDGEHIVFMTFIDDTHVSLPMPDGSNKIFETSQDGLMAYQEALGVTDLAMLK